jgi:hypothetical protein
MSWSRLDEHGCELAYHESDCIAVAALVLDTVTTREEPTMTNTDPQTSDDYWSHYLEVWQAMPLGIGGRRPICGPSVVGSAADG